MDKGITLMLAPKSHKALSMTNLPTTHGIEKLPGSFSLGGILFCRQTMNCNVGIQPWHIFIRPRKHFHIVMQHLNQPALDTVF